MVDFSFIKNLYLRVLVKFGLHKESVGIHIKGSSNVRMEDNTFVGYDKAIKVEDSNFITSLRNKILRKK
jgi:parallel beta-helix repeat protein